jgi:hypothetical protein
MTVMAHAGVWPRRILRLWQQYEAMALEVTFHHPDDRSESTFEVSLPAWPWRWVCWIQGHSDNTYGECVVCKARLSRR